MKKIYLIRHAQSESNAGLSIRPNHSIALTSTGQTQAQDLAEWLYQQVPQPTQVFVSKFIRTQQTAQPYLDKIKQSADVLADLFEFDYLDFKQIEHLNYQQLREQSDAFWLKNDIYYQSSEQCDSFAHFVQRVKNVRQALADLPDGIYVVFTHGMWLGMLMWQLLQLNEQKILDMQQFAKFEFAIRPKNCEVFNLNFNELKQESIIKIRANLDDIVNEGESKVDFQHSTTK